MSKKTLSERLQEALGLIAPPVAPALEAPAPDPEPEVDGNEGFTAEREVLTARVTSLEALVVEATASVEALNTELAAATAASDELKAKNAELALQVANLEGVKTAAEALAATVRGYCSDLNVALGGTSSDFNEVNLEELASRHEQLKTSFEARFPVGGKSKVDADVAPVPTAHNVAPLVRRAVQATNLR